MGYSSDMVEGDEAQLNLGVIASERIEIPDEILDMLPEDAISPLTFHIANNPGDRDATLGLGLCLFQAEDVLRGCDVICNLARRLIYQGRVLEAVFVVHQGLRQSPKHPTLQDMLRRIHSITVEVKRGEFEAEHPMTEEAPEDVTLEALKAAQPQDRHEIARRLVASYRVPGDPMIPLPVPLLSELNESNFVMMVDHLQYRRVPDQRVILEEGDKRDSIVVVVNGHMNVSRGGKHLGKVGPGIVLGESGLLTRETLPVSVHAHHETEYFELTRLAVRDMARTNTRIVTQLQSSFYKQIRGNILNTAPLFELFEDYAQYILIEEFEIAHFDPGAVIVEPGNASAPLYIVASGSVELRVVADEADPVIFEVAIINESLGAISHPVNGAQVDAVARSRVTVLKLDAEKFEGLFADHPKAREYLENLAKRRLAEAQAL
ncbi:MAG: cyclic nucleotide-binding domain-containing protein [Deltaproteobacteria bacterium]|nr:cyclic nucleotide-binding domain-containing protein [Deltaproteobacteria bacterium]